MPRGPLWQIMRQYRQAKLRAETTADHTSELTEDCYLCGRTRFRNDMKDWSTQEEVRYICKEHVKTPKGT